MRGLASRRIAVEILLKVERDGAFANQALSVAFDKHSLTERDRAFVTNIVYGTIRNQNAIDDELRQFSKKPVDKLTPALRAVLRSAIFQLLHLDDMPPSAVINTAVEIARKTGHEGSAKFANGILRTFVRSQKPKDEAGDSTDASESSEPSESDEVSISGESAKKAVLNIPAWLTNRWFARYGQPEGLKLVEQSQAIPPLILRTCELSISTEGLIDIFKAKGMDVKRSELAPCCIIVLDRGPITGPVNKIPGYDEGLFTVQDDASALVSLVVAPASGQTIIDLCAAPGGKSIHLGELMENKGRVLAVDSNGKRLSLLANERRRLGLANIETVCADGRNFKPEQLCDAVLLDAPCSGTGVISRRTDLRQNREEAHIKTLVETQRALLENAALMVKPGGTFVYSTCSIEPEENQENLAWFLQTHPNYRPVGLEQFFSAELLTRWSGESHWDETRNQLQNGFVQLLPSRHNCSGFFIARLAHDS